jgi:alkyl hydroperoxide reductase subunit AhpC
VAQLCRQQDELKRLNATVLVVSFSANTEAARAWLKETCPSFTMLLDPERKVYRAYGLESSWLGTVNATAAWDYLRLLLSGQRVRGIEADPYQLGGDFIVDTKGILRLAYRSRVATDFPPVADLLAILGKLHQESADGEHG